MRNSFAGRIEKVDMFGRRKQPRLRDVMKEMSYGGTTELRDPEDIDRELSEEELDSAAGGACNDTTGTEALLSVISAGLACAASAIYSAAAGHVGQKDDDEGRICTYT